jgi:dipeptidase E
MRLYLSSYGLGDNAAALRDLAGSKARTAVIFNARDAYRGERLKYVEQEFAALRALGFSCEELDLRSYFGDEDGLRARLASCDLVFAVGGNTFVLARAMTEAGFRAAIREQLVENRIVYGGYSAGACVVGPDLDGCHLIDEPDAVADGYSPDVRPEALGWVPWRIVPHWRSEHEESQLAELAVAHLLEAGLPFQTLRDGQAFIVNDGEHHLAQVPVAADRHRACDAP